MLGRRSVAVTIRTACATRPCFRLAAAATAHSYKIGVKLAVVDVAEWPAVARDDRLAA
jgi:hypothetical protein